MISFNILGNLGRLGNQMFQYASLRGIAANRGFDFCIPPKNVFGASDPNVKNCPTNIYTAFGINKYPQGIPDNTIIKESGFHFDEDLFNTCNDDADLYGYFQSEKYFKHIEEDIRKDFTFADDVVNSCADIIANEIGTPELISLHIRRSDYLHLQTFHPVPPIEYYIESLKKLPNVPVLIFTDDIDWCMMQSVFDPDRFFISQSNSAEHDMCFMTMCKYHIIANSSFSWWGAWLAKSEKVIAPKNWFGPSLMNCDTSDLYCNGWETL